MIKSDFGTVELKGELALIMTELTSIILSIKKIHEKNGFPEEITKRAIMHSVELAFMNAAEVKENTKKMAEELPKEVVEAVEEKVKKVSDDFVDRLLKDIFGK